MDSTGEAGLPSGALNLTFLLIFFGVIALTTL